MLLKFITKGESVKQSKAKYLTMSKGRAHCDAVMKAANSRHVEQVFSRDEDDEQQNGAHVTRA